MFRGRPAFVVGLRAALSLTPRAVPAPWAAHDQRLPSERRGAPASGGREHRNGPPGPRLREGLPAGGMRLEDELARVVEVGWLNAVGVRGRKHDQLRPA